MQRGNQFKNYAFKNVRNKLFIKTKFMKIWMGQKLWTSLNSSLHLFVKMSHGKLIIFAGRDPKLELLKLFLFVWSSDILFFKKQLQSSHSSFWTGFSLYPVAYTTKVKNQLQFMYSFSILKSLHDIAIAALIKKAVKND